MKTESQNKRIKAWLESGRGLTPLTALHEFGCWALSSRISDLKKEPYNMKIKTVMHQENGKRFARYVLEG